MPPKRKKYKIVKVSLGYEPQFRSPVFEPVSRLYMELLEKKVGLDEFLENEPCPFLNSEVKILNDSAYCISLTCIEIAKAFSINPFEQRSADTEWPLASF